MKENSKDNNLSIMTYTLNSGITQTIPLSPEQIKMWSESFKTKTNFVVHTGKEFFGLSPSEIASFRIHNEASEHFVPLRSIVKEPVVNIPQKEFEDKSLVELKKAYSEKLYSNKDTDKKNLSNVLFLLECSCGTKRVEYLNPFTHKVMCGKCNNYVFRDVECPQVETGEGLAYVLTNKRWVNRDKSKKYVEMLRMTTQ